jgi:hypothetical protein
MANNKRFSVLIAATILGLGACGGGGGDDDCMGGNGYGGSGGGGGGGGGETGTTCAEIVDCFDACTTDACAQDCIDAGSPAAQDLMNDVLACVAQYSCTDSACVEAHCLSQVDACYADSGTGGGGGGGGPTGDPLPASIVGTWGSAEGNATIVYSFTADGRVSYSAGLYTGYGTCNSKSVWVYDGVVGLSGDTITLQPTSGTYSSYGCSGELISSDPYTDVERDRFATGVDAEGAVLQLTDLDTGNVTTYHHQ